MLVLVFTIITYPGPNFFLMVMFAVTNLISCSITMFLTTSTETFCEVPSQCGCPLVISICPAAVFWLYVMRASVDASGQSCMWSAFVSLPLHKTSQLLQLDCKFLEHVRLLHEIPLSWVKQVGASLDASYSWIFKVVNLLMYFVSCKWGFKYIIFGSCFRTWPIVSLSVKQGELECFYC